MEKFFKVKEKGSTVKTEVIAGVTTFMAMAYILMVNAGMFADPFGDGTNVLGVFILIDGLVFILLTITGLRKIIFNAIPQAVKQAIPAGIGLFIAFIGLQNVGLVVNDASTCVGLASFNLLGSATWASIMPLLVTILAVCVIAILAY